MLYGSLGAYGRYAAVVDGSAELTLAARKLKQTRSLTLQVLILLDAVGFGLPDDYYCAADHVGDVAEAAVQFFELL